MKPLTGLLISALEGEVLLQFIASPVFSQHVETGYYLKIIIENESQIQIESTPFRHTDLQCVV